MSYYYTLQKEDEANMDKDKFKKDYFPDLRNLAKELEDAIIDRDEEKEKELIIRFEIVLRKIRKSKFADE